MLNFEFNWDDVDPAEIIAANDCDLEDDIFGIIEVTAKDGDKAVEWFLVDIHHYYYTKADSGFDLEVYFAKEDFSLHAAWLDGLIGIHRETNFGRFRTRAEKRISEYLNAMSITSHFKELSKGESA